MRHRFGETARNDRWWITPVVVFLVLASFVVYATWAAFQGEHYRSGPYLSPFYSPELFGVAARLVRAQARLVAGLAALFARAADPLGAGRFPLHLLLLSRRLLQGVLGRSAVLHRRRASRERTCGERSFPLILQNVHRYFLYLALLVPRHPVATTCGTRSGSPIARRGDPFGIGVGTLVLAVNVVLLGGYTLGCHSLRHLVGGAARPAVEAARARKTLRLRQLPQPAPHELGVVQPRSGSRSPICTCACAPWASGTDCEIFCDGRNTMRDRSSTTSWSSAPAARVCARRSRRRRPASRSAWSASRCSARRTRSWPRAAWRRRWPTSTTATAGASISPTRCAAGSTSTTGAWPSCTPRKPPTACASSKRGGRCSTAPTDGRILQRNFGGHTYPRLAHVGDRTGLEMIRTLQDHGIHPGITSTWNARVISAAHDGGPRGRRVRL